jgi:transposase
VSRPRGPAQRLEARRAAALDLLGRGLSLTVVARALGCAPSSVMRWRDAFRKRGKDALVVKKSPGRPPRLTSAQRRTLRNLLARGGRASGFQTDPWTAARITFLIESRFNVRYHPRHVGRLVRRLDQA